MGQDVGAVIPAAGRGVRLGSRQAKAFVPLAKQPLVLQTLQVFECSPSVRWVVVAVRPADCAQLKRLVDRHRLRKIAAIVPGGASRAESVARGVAALPPEVRWVVIHDGARPCVSPRLIASAVAQAKRHGAVVCGLPASLTVKAVDAAQHVRLTLDRDSLWFVQTPQVFRRDWLDEALARCNGQLQRFPDDAALMEWAGFAVRMVPGDSLNIKVTTKEDLLLAEAILKSQNSKGKSQK